MLEEDFVKRLIHLRLVKNVSAREMSLSIGQNTSYINNIESGKALPSMSAFFFICDYLNITPGEFFNTQNNYPNTIKQIIDDLNHLNPEQLKHISAIIKDLGKV